MLIKKMNKKSTNGAPHLVKNAQTPRRGVNALKTTSRADTKDSRKGGRDGVAGKKASRRGALSKNSLVPAWIVAELPCQKAIVGATYREGQPVFACIKYREQIVRYPAPGELCTVFDKFSAHATFHIDNAHFGRDQVSANIFKIFVNANGEVVCRETLSREVGIISDQEGVENLALKICRDWSFDHFQAQLAGYLRAGKLSMALHKMRCAVEMALVRKAVSAWRSYIKNARPVCELSPAGKGGIRKQPAC